MRLLELFSTLGRINYNVILGKLTGAFDLPCSEIRINRQSRKIVCLGALAV